MGWNNNKKKSFWKTYWYMVRNLNQTHSIEYFNWLRVKLTKIKHLKLHRLKLNKSQTTNIKIIF